MKFIRIYCILVGTILSVCGQTASQGVGSGGVLVVDPREASYERGLGLFASGNPNQAESALEASNLSKPGTAAWEIESGFLLMRAAFDLRGQGGYSQVRGIANRALAHFTSASKKFSNSDDPAFQANMYVLAAQVYDKLLGDRASAEQCYGTALQLDPKSTSAAEALDRMQREDAELQRRHGNNH